MATFIIAAIVVVLMALAVMYMVKNWKKNGSSCGCGCSGCSSSKSCHSAKR